MGPWADVSMCKVEEEEEDEEKEGKEEEGREKDPAAAGFFLQLLGLI